LLEESGELSTKVFVLNEVVSNEDIDIMILLGAIEVGNGNH
jgi:hypothetical protein